MSQQPPSPVQPLETIADVYYVPFKSFADERGRFAEIFRREWFPQVSWERIQSNRSDSVAGVLRGVHYHHHQIDYWTVAAGTIRVALVDMRPASPTHRVATTIDIGPENNIGLFIPVGVAHGFLALTDCTLIYVVNNYYDGGADEQGIAWNDPELGIEWGLEREPILSERDRNNPLLRDIPPNNMP
ncbi:MAG: dTDP-4-keto-6-deoxy-D-glucose epimerase [Chloroflexi bacterium]|nr:MAG: dTDP-4-keto-6-deoxy-D-glucose epimerase [Chloroflexota bacterium]